MRFLFVTVLTGLCTLALGIPYQEQGHLDGQKHYFKVADHQHLYKQNNILRLFKYVNQPSYYSDHVQIAKTYAIEHNLDAYAKPEVVKHFLYYYHHDILPRDHIFSVFHQEHLKQAIALFKVLYYAKNYDVFYKTAVWARNHVNQGIYLYALSVAVFHRPDTYGIVLPPIYEVYPYYFYNAEVIQKAHHYKQLYGGHQQHEQAYTIYANYSGHYLNIHPEQSLSYFTEDVGINAYYYYYNLYRPFWMSSDEYGINSYHRGEEFYYFYQQFLARYYLERLSNDFGEIGVYDYECSVKTGYTPSLHYPNGLAFPQRPNWAKFGKNYYNYGQSYFFQNRYDLVKDYERRIREAIDAKYVITEDGKTVHLFEEEGFNTLGNLIEANPQSPHARFYGYLQIFARHLLGYAKQPLHKYQVVPSVLEHFETSLRDPVFYQFYKRIVHYFQQYQNYQAYYNYTDLVFPGVKVENVQVDQLVTYFEAVDADISNVVYVEEQEYKADNVHVHVRQQRLNHKPFTYKINVVSNKPAEAVVRVFIGPKYDEHGRHIDINENRLNFVEFDTFKYDLKSGQNTIVRNSHQNYFSDDYTSQKHLHQQMNAVVNADEVFQVYGSEVQYTFPKRYLLPKGKRGGQTYQLYVIVSPYKRISSKVHHYDQEYHHEQQFKPVNHYYPIVGLGVQKIDSYPLGYPFERTIVQHQFYVPNSYFKDVVIYHKDV